MVERNCKHCRLEFSWWGWSHIARQIDYTIKHPQCTQRLLRGKMKEIKKETKGAHCTGIITVNHKGVMQRFSRKPKEPYAVSTSNEEVSLLLCCAGSRPHELILSSFHIWFKTSQLWHWHGAMRGHHRVWSESRCLRVAQMTHKLHKQLETMKVCGRSL